MSDWAVTQDNTGATSAQDLKGTQGPPDNQSGGDGGGWEDALPSILGTAGSMAGEALGTPFDLVSGPAGTMVGGTGGGAIGGGVGAAIKDAIQGKFSWGDVLGNAAQQGAYGAIPGVSEAKLGGKLGTGILGRTIQRAVGGGALSAGGQAASDIGQGQTPGSDVLGAGMAGGAFNAVAPGAGALFNQARKIPAMAAFGAKAGSKLSDIINETGNIQGKNADEMATNLHAQTGKTSALEDKMQDTLGGAGQGIQRSAINDAFDEAMNENKGTDPDTLQQMDQMKTNWGSALDDLLLNNNDYPSFMKDPEMVGSGNTMSAIQDEGTQVHPAVAQNLMDLISKDLGDKGFQNPNGPIAKMIVGARGKLRDLITGSLQNPEDQKTYNNIQSMREAAHQINSQLRGNGTGGGFEKAAKVIGGQNPLLGILADIVGGGISTFGGNPLLGAGLIGAERYATTPKNAINIAQGTIGPKALQAGTKKVGSAAKRLLQQGAGAIGAAANSQQ
jgi:hypothetical protein